MQKHVYLESYRVQFVEILQQQWPENCRTVAASDIAVARDQSCGLDLRVDP